MNMNYAPMERQYIDHANLEIHTEKSRKSPGLLRFVDCSNMKKEAQRSYETLFISYKNY